MHSVTAITALGLIFSLPTLLVQAAQQQEAQADQQREVGADQQQDQTRKTGKEVEKLHREQAESEYRLPSAQRKDEAGQALLSWRVDLLPYLGYRNLYEQFHLDEPWDSPHNRQLIGKMPPIYRAHGPVESGKTTFVALVSEDSAISSEEGGIRFGDITDGASNTILFVEADPECAVIWTKPDDIQFDPQQPFKCLGGHGATFQAVFADGSVRAIPTTIDAETMRRLVSRHDGKPVTLP